MNSIEYSKRAPITDVSPHTLDYYLKGMVEELGEFFGHLKRIERDDRGKITPERFAKMKEEMGDFEWYRIRAWAKICELLGTTFIPLEQVWDENILKLADREERGVIRGEGSER